MKWTWNSQFCLVLSQSAGREQLRLRGTPHLKMSTVITSSAPRQGLANTELSETLVFFPPPSIEVNCSMKFKKKFRMCSITVVKCLLSITWWHTEKKSVYSPLGAEEASAGIQEFHSWCCGTVQKNMQKKTYGDTVLFIVYCTNCKGLRSKPDTWDSSSLIYVFSVFSPLKSLQFLQGGYIFTFSSAAITKYLGARYYRWPQKDHKTFCKVYIVNVYHP